MEPQTFTATAKEQSLILIVPKPAPVEFPDALAGSEVYFLPADQPVAVNAETGAECAAFVAPVPTTQRSVDRAEQVTDAAANPGRRVLSLMPELGASHALRAEFPWATGEISPGATIELDVSEAAAVTKGEGNEQVLPNTEKDAAEDLPPSLGPAYGDTPEPAPGAEHGDALTTEALHEAGVAVPLKRKNGRPTRPGEDEL